MDATNLIIRRARRGDVPDVVRLLADDGLGKTRERYADPLPTAYYAAFEQIDADPRHELVVAELEGHIVGTLHLMELVSLTRFATKRLEIEGVRVDAARRGQGIGEWMMRWAIRRAAERGCGMVQLTTDARRLEAQAFYQRLGFVASHLGMKLSVGGDAAQGDAHSH